MAILALILIFNLVVLISAEQCFVPGRCERSEYLHSTLVNNANDCLHHCQANPECGWFTVEADGLCIEFSECVELSADVCPQCTSGESTCPEFYSCFNPGECHGTFISAHKDIKKEIDCLEICKAQNTDPLCGWYTYRSDIGYCFTYEDCILDTSVANASSGQKNCSMTSGILKSFNIHSLHA